MKVKRFSPKQRQVMTWWCQGDRYDAIICDGAVRSGKTLCMGLSFICWAMTRFHGQQFGLCGKTIVSLRRNLLFELLPILKELGFSCREVRSENLVRIRYQGHENRFLLFGGRDESSAALIQGITFAGVLLDEAVLMPRSFVEQACARCSVSGSKLWFNCNPQAPQHWFYREWIQQAEKRRTLYLHFTMEDNPALSPKIRARYQRSYSGVFYRRFVLGEWTAASGLVYDFFEPALHCRDAPAEPMEQYCVSVDYGTANPCSFGLWGRKQGIWYRLEEFYYDSRREGRQKTDAEYVEDMKSLLRGRRAERIIVDPSAASFIQALRQAGFCVCKAENEVLDGIRITADALKSGRLVICPACRDCLREIGLYCWQEEGRDAPKKEHDHAMDELRYFAVFTAKPKTVPPFFAGFVERRS